MSAREWGSVSKASVALPHAAASAAAARDALRRFLLAESVPHAFVDDAVLVVSELVGNSLRHARARSDGTVLVRWTLAGAELTVDVVDGGGHGSPQLRSPAADATSGRGLTIVDRIALAWGTRRDRAGAVTWARLRVHVAASTTRRGVARGRQVQQPPHRHRDFGDRGEQLVG